jgi:hypothetical protein
MINVAPGDSANQITLFTANCLCCRSLLDYWVIFLNERLSFFLFIYVLRFNIATFVCLSQAMTCISKALCRGIYFVLNGLSERWLSV